MIFLIVLKAALYELKDYLKASCDVKRDWDKYFLVYKTSLESFKLKGRLFFYITNFWN